MDNMKYYTDSLAYDFSAFMPKEARENKRDNIVKIPQTRVKTAAKPRRISVSAFAVMASVIMLGALCGNIFLRLQINEVNSKINALNKQIDTLDSEKTSLEVALERKISYSNIEIEATELGMKKKDKSQVKYIRVNDKDSATKNGNVVSSKK